MTAITPNGGGTVIATPSLVHDGDGLTLYCADARDIPKLIPAGIADAVLTSPPYRGLRDYGHSGQIGVEESVETYLNTLADTLDAVARHAMKKTGSLWVNLGDTYAMPSRSGARRGKDASGVERPTKDAECGRCGKPFTGGIDQFFCSSTCGGSDNARKTFPPKCLLMLPERFALAMIQRGWTLRNKVVWHKPNAMPTSARDRLSNKWEYLFHFVLVRHWEGGYGYDLDPIKNDNDANPGDVWSIPTKPFPEAHFAVFPEELVRRPILATVPPGGTVLDPFFGSGTTGVVALAEGRRCIGVDLNADYCALALRRMGLDSGHAITPPKSPENGSERAP